MGLRYGIVGLSNVGKSTLFNALAKVGIEAASFPFRTIESSIGVAPMPDPRLDKPAEIVRSQRILPTTTELVDIAGLVRGVSKGEGLGDQFLTGIRETETIGHMIRCFEDDNITHVNNKVGPADDIDVISTGLAFSDLGICEHAIHHVQKKTRGGNKDAKAELAALKKCLPQLENAGMLRSLKDLIDEDKMAIEYLSSSTLKPAMYATSINEDGLESNPYLDKIRGITAAEGSVVVVVRATVKSDITELDDANRDESMVELGLEEPGLNHVIRADYELLNLQTYFTAGMKEIRAWAIPIGITAPQVAGKAHTDFEKGLTRMQTTACEDSTTYKGERDVREADKMRTGGKDYIVKDDDVMNFLFNV